jgi:hypothetical protein
MLKHLPELRTTKSVHKGSANLFKQLSLKVQNEFKLGFGPALNLK